jgi:predicted amidohydrolase YtcJ
VKVFHGGSVSAHTCWVSEPYVGVDGHPQGLKPARSQERLDALILSLHRAGLQACVHCNGDREIDMVVTAFERALTAYPRADHRHRLEHCSVVTPELLRRIKATGLVVVSDS